MKLGICAWVLPVSEIESFQVASRLGLDGVVIDYGIHSKENPLLSLEGQQRYMNEARRYNLEIPTMAINFFCQAGMIKHEHKEFAKDVIASAVHVAAAMNIAKIQIPSFYDNLVQTEQDLINTIEMFKFACQIGEKKNVYIGTENVLTISQHQRLIKEVDSPYLVTLFDTQNPWRMANQDGPRIAEYMEPYTIELHAKDSIIDNKNLLQLGEGDVKFMEIMSIFAKKKFDQWIQLESKYNYEGYEIVIEKDIQIIKNLLK